VHGKTWADLHWRRIDSTNSVVLTLFLHDSISICPILPLAIYFLPPLSVPFASHGIPSGVLLPPCVRLAPIILLWILGFAMASYQYASKLEGDLTDLQADADRALQPPRRLATQPSNATLSPSVVGFDTDSQRTVQAHEFPPMSNISAKAPPPVAPAAEKEVALQPFQSLPLSEDALRPLGKGTKAGESAYHRANKWIRFRIWYSTYRKFWTFVVTLNVVGVIFTLLGRFPYASRYPGAMVLGNLLMAILMRNEIFGRFLYLLVNTLFAKVCGLVS
jgi:hypothetical protein